MKNFEIIKDSIGAANAWNKIQTAFGDVIMKNLTAIQIKTLVTKNALVNIGKYFFHLIFMGRLY